jgi:glucose-6-phosphate 1-epimerase
VVTWNPTEKSGAGIVDMEPNGWVRDCFHLVPMCHSHVYSSSGRQNHYVCVEPGHVSDFKTLKPGEKWIGQQVLTVL